MGKPRLAGVDIGSTNCKVGVYTEAGRPIAERRRPTTSDCAELVAGVLEDLADCVERAGPPDAVGITSMAETGVGLGADLEPLHPLLRWDDPRGAGQVRTLDRRLGGTELFTATGVHLSVKTPLARWLWLRDTRPELLTATRTWVNTADLVATVLIGRPVTDRTLAGRTGALNQHSGDYDARLLGEVGLSAGQLPEVTTGVAGTVRATTGGLRAGTPVVVAGHDHLVAAYAAGVRAVGDTADSLGTAEAVITVSGWPPDPATSARGLSWNRHADGANWVLVSGFPDSGAVAEWAAVTLLGSKDPEAFSAAIEPVRRPTGILVEPYLSGRGAPDPDPDRRLRMSGVDGEHGAAELALAVLEGCCLHVRWMAEVQAGHAGTTLGGCTALGGPTRNRGWMAVKADVMPGPVRVTEADAAVAGAALLAGRAIGLAPGVLPATTLPRHPDRAARYQALYTEQFLVEAAR